LRVSLSDFGRSKAILPSVIRYFELSVAQLPGLPAIHRDPFDRMLICQALAHGLTLASSDPLIHQYPVTIL
jgi:PIN domain nuclease of toxin-antitoxin system